MKNDKFTIAGLPSDGVHSGIYWIVKNGVKQNEYFETKKEAKESINKQKQNDRRN
jgi:hypothetical protein